MAFVMHEKKVDTSKIETSFVVLEEFWNIEFMEKQKISQKPSLNSTVLEQLLYHFLIISMHTTKLQKSEELPSLPGFGYSSVKKNRKIADWHLDVDVILKKEKIEKFWVRGVSFGSLTSMENEF
jgi:hypothetical protein